MKIQENPRDSKMLQEDDKSDARRSKDPLQEKNLQEDSMDESLNIPTSMGFGQTMIKTPKINSKGTNRKLSRF